MSLDLLTRHLRRIEVSYGRDGWHEEQGPPPALYALYTDRLRWVPLRPEQWGDPHVSSPGYTLLKLADLIPQVDSFRGQLDRWYGMAFICEAWLTHVDDAFTEWLAESRQLYRHPDRISIRIALGVSREQHRVAVVRRQDEPAEIEVVGDDVRQTGVVMDGLIAIVAALDAIALAEEE